MSILFIFFLSCAISRAFLIETSTGHQYGYDHGISGQDFYTLNQMLHNEHERSIQLQQYVSKLESRLNTLELNCNCASAGIHPLTPLETKDLEEKYSQLESKLITMTHHITHIGSKMNSLEKNISEVTNKSSIIQLPSIQNVFRRVHSLENKVSILSSNNITLGHLQHSALTNEQRLKNVINEHILITSNLSLLDNLQKSMEARLQSMENIQMNDKNLFNTFYLNVTKQLDMLHNNEMSLNSQIQNSLSQMVTDHQSYKNNLTYTFEKVSQNKAKLTNLESGQQSINASLNRNMLYTNHQIHLMMTKQTDFNRMFAILNQTVSHFSDSLAMATMQLHGMISQTNAVTRNYVVLTANGIGVGVKLTESSVMRFPDILESHGVSDRQLFADSGVFRCEHQGLYLIISTIMSCQESGDADYVYLYKNTQTILQFYIDFTSGNVRNCESGTGSAVISLSVNDEISIKLGGTSMEVYGRFSSISIVKLF